MTHHADGGRERLFADVGLDRHVTLTKLSQVTEFPALLIFHLSVLPSVSGGQSRQEYRVYVLVREEDGSESITDELRFPPELGWDDVEQLAMRFCNRPRRIDLTAYRFTLTVNSQN